MDHDALMALFRRLTLVGAPMLVGGCGGMAIEGCPPEHDTTTTVSLASLQQDAAVVDAGSADGGLEDLCRRAVPYERIVRCELVTADGGEPAVQVVHTPFCVGGRRPAGLASCDETGSPGPLGAWLASTAYLEAASVDAFEIMAAELAAHRAPGALVEAARAAAADERRHARVLTRLALRTGVRPAEVRVARQPPRDLETIAAENAVEGCVRETFAALIACRQGQAAEDAAVRRAMRGIALDETRHAALAWAVDAWAGGVLPPAARRHARELRRAAVDELRRATVVDAPASLRRPAGLPDGAEAARLSSELFAHLA